MYEAPAPWGRLNVAVKWRETMMIEMSDAAKWQNAADALNCDAEGQVVEVGFVVKPNSIVSVQPVVV